MKFSVKVILTFMFYLLPQMCFATAKAVEFPPDISCVGQLPSGEVLKVVLNLNMHEMIFQGKTWPISVLKYSVKGVLSAASTTAVGKPNTFFSLAVKEGDGMLMFYNNGTLKGSTPVICQDVASGN